MEGIICIILFFVGLGTLAKGLGMMYPPLEYVVWGVGLLFTVYELGKAISEEREERNKE